MKIITKEEFMEKTVSAGVSAEASGGFETLPDMSNYGGVKFNCGCGSKHKIKETSKYMISNMFPWVVKKSFFI